MDRELLLEIGCEELPADWLPALTNQLSDVVGRELRTARLVPEGPVETFSTPRRLTARVARVADRQTDLEELLTGPPVSASFMAGGTPTAAAAGFASKHGVDASALERVETAKGAYVAYRRKQRGKAAVDVLPGVLGGVLRSLAFPKLMHWDATLGDGRGDLLFGRPIRWLLFIYGGRVVPFTIARTAIAESAQVQEVGTGAVTYGHRFLTTSGRAGRAIKVRSFDEYRARLLENFVMLEREERHNKIARELDAKAWPERKERAYTLVPTTCFNCEAGCGLVAYVDQATGYEWKPEIVNATAHGTVVVCDRYLASSVAYGEAQGLDPSWLLSMQQYLPQPDITILLDIPPEASARRKRTDRDRYEQDLALLGRVRDSYLRLAAQGWVRIDADRDRDAVTADVWAAVHARLSPRP